jgi:hypothetical protein
VDELAPNTDTVNQTTFSPNATDATAITVTNGARFRVGDFIRPGNAREVMAVTAVVGNVLTCAGTATPPPAPSPTASG